MGAGCSGGIWRVSTMSRASTKSRGEGIGFAGVGIKLGLLVCARSSPRRGAASTHVSTTWCSLAAARAVEVDPAAGLVAERGTAVRLRLSNPLSPLLDAGYLEEAIRRHFEPLLDPIRRSARTHYSHGIVRGRGSEWRSRASTRRAGASADRGRLAGSGSRPRRLSGAQRRAARRGPAGHRGQHVRESHQARLGLAGDDAGGADRISGLIEAPDLAASLTLNKADFIRTGPRGATFAYRKAIQEVVTRSSRCGVTPSAADLRAAVAPPARSSATSRRCSPVSPTTIRCSPCS